MKRTIFTHHLKKIYKNHSGKIRQPIKRIHGYIKALEVVEGKILELAPRQLTKIFNPRPTSRKSRDNK